MGASPRDLMNADDEFISYGNVIGDGSILFAHLYTIDHFKPVCLTIEYID